MFQRPHLIIVILVLIAALLITRYFGQANPGGKDDGLLHLAGATAILHYGDYPIVQRPPLYSLILAALAIITSAVTDETTPAAQELGSIITFEVADGLLEPDFLKAAFCLNLLLWIGTTSLLVATLRYLNIHWRWVYAAVLVAFIPSSWRMVGSVSETTLCQFLIVVGVFCLVRTKLVGFHAINGSAEQTPLQNMLWLFFAGTAFALAGFTRATFQFLVPVVTMALFITSRRVGAQVPVPLQIIAFMFLPWLILVGGWSLHNQTRHGFLGVSGVGGVALSTRTAFYLERAAANFPEEAEIFSQIRNQTFVDEANKNDVVYWGARASNWLMANRDMSYLDANRFLTSFNLSAIRAAPLNYVDVVANSLVNFHFPGVNAEWPAGSRLLWSAAEFAVMGAFVLLSLLWLSLQLLALLKRLRLSWELTDNMITLLLIAFWYTALVSSAVDVGKPEHRMTIQVIVPMTIVLLAGRLNNVKFVE